MILHDGTILLAQGSGSCDRGGHHSASGGVVADGSAGCRRHRPARGSASPAAEHLFVGLILLGILFGPAASAEFADSASYPAIQQAFLREDHETVVSLAQAFLTQSPAAPQASQIGIWLAISLDRLGRVDEALHTLDRLKAHLERDDPLWPELVYWEGDISRGADRLTQAQRAWTQLLEEFPDSRWASSQVRLSLGLSFVSQEAFGKALEHLRAIKTNTPHDPMALEVRLLQGLCLLRLQRFEEAMAMFEPLLEELREPDEVARATFYLAEASSRLGRHAEAIQAYRRARRMDPDSRWGQLSWFGLGWAQFQLGRCQESVATLAGFYQRTAVGHKTEALFAWGTCLMQLGEDEQASRLLHRLLEREPSHPLAGEGELLIAEIDRRGGRLREAAARLERLLGQAQDASLRAAAHLRLGTVRLAQGDSAGATDHFGAARQASELEIHLAALNGLGDIQMYVGDYQKAQRRYEEVRGLWEQADTASPAGSAGPVTPAYDGWAYALYQLGRIQLLRGEYTEAVASFRRLIREAPPPLADDARLALALTAVHQHDETHARRQLHAIRQTQMGSVVAARAAYYLAMLALAEGREETVRALCQEALAGAPGSAEGVEAHIVLAELDVGRGSSEAALARLRTVFDTPGLAIHHRGTVAKRLGDFLRGRADFAQAIHWYELAAALAPSLRGEVAYRLASCYEEAGDMEVAISRYRAALGSGWMVRGQLAAAKLLERQGQWEAAEAVYASLAEEPIPEAKVAREHLASLRGDGMMEEIR